jgi:hypothetical protein
MIKHIPSQADVDMLIDDEGNLFVFCKQIQKMWTAKLEPHELPSSAGAAILLTSGLKRLSEENRSVFEGIGMKAELIDSMFKKDL